jgi:spermidine/putrescine transport system substrate-binding protein
MPEKDQGKERARQEAAHRIDRAVISRRELLRRSGAGLLVVGAAPAILAACGGGEETGETAAATTEAPAATTAAPETGAVETAAPDTTEVAAVPEASGTIDYLSWEGYDIPDQLKPWRQEHGVKVNATYIGNHDDIQAKITAGGGSYDIITYYQGYKRLYAELGILSPIDTSKIPNVQGLFPYFQSDVGNFWIDPDGTWTGIPWTWGSIGLTWDDAVLPGGLQSWYDLLEPKFKDKIGLPDDPQGSFALASHVLGYDPGALPKDKLPEVVDLLTQIVKQAKSVAASFGDLTTQLVAGDIVACWQGWAAMNSFAKDAGNDTVMTRVPKEGSFSFCDLYAIPSTSDNVDTALAWFNEAIDPQVNAAAAEYLVAAVTVADAVQHLDAATAALYPYEELESLLERAPFYNLPPVESDEFVTYQEWTDTWQEVKASA